MPRIFDPKKGTIVRETPGDAPGADGLRDIGMERKIMRAAMDLLKKQDDELGNIISSALEAAETRMGRRVDGAGKAHREAIDELSDALRDLVGSAVKELKAQEGSKVVGAVERVTQALAALQEAQNDMANELRAEIKAQVALAVESLTEEIKASKQRRYTADVTARDAQGRTKTVSITTS